MNWFYDYREKEIINKVINTSQTAELALDDLYKSISNRLQLYKKNMIRKQIRKGVSDG